MTKFRINLFFLSVLLLLCSSVFGERGESPQRRRLAVGDRATVAPIGKGKGDKSSKKSSKSKGKGKGMKSEKSSKSEKKFGKYMKDAVGKGSKSEKSVKFMKSLKSIKGEKSSKKSKKGPSTIAPTSADSISSKSSVYAISYAPTTKVPTSEDLEELTMVTQEYLEDFMMDFFDKTALTDLDNFLTIMIRDAYAAGEPFIAEYQSNGLFDPDSIFIPVTREINNLIEDAIAADEYLYLLSTLPKSNPFSGTEEITFTIGSGTTGGDSTSGTSSFVKAGVAAAAAGVVVLAAGLAMLKSRRKSDDDDDDNTESFEPRKAEDVTIAGDTCVTTGEESSGHFSHWRTAKSDSNGLEGGEFQDEPLDN